MTSTDAASRGRIGNGRGERPCASMGAMKAGSRARASRLLFALSLSCVALCASREARAQQGEELSRAERDEVARTHFRAGSRFFDQRRFAEAAGEFELVFELIGQGALMFNAGRSWEAAGRWREAIRAYRRFLETREVGAARASLEASIRTLEQRVADEERAAAAAAQRTSVGCPEPGASASANATATSSASAANTAQTASTGAIAPTAMPSSSASLMQLQTRVTYQHRTLDATAPWVLLGVGGVIGGLSVWQAASYTIDSARVQSATTWSADLTIAQDSAREASRNAILGGSIGGVFLATSVLWFALRGRGERREEVLRTAWVAPSPGGVIAGGRF
jgi:hypothetical protein